MAEVKMTFEGQEQMQRAFDKVRKQFPERILSIMTLTAEKIMTISKREVPVDFGILRSSGHVIPAKKSGKGFIVQMVYGGAADAYALIQHENLFFNHTVGGPKYLERPLLAFDVAREFAGMLR